MPRAAVLAQPDRAPWRLAAIGTLAGAFSGLFGVGGGTVIVPLLIFWFGYGERLATGTSLAAIVLIGLLGAVAQGGIYGNVHVLTGLLLSIPAVLGVLLGTAIQQRIPQRTVSYLFAALLVAIAVELVLS
ncbi:MAG TPA: sulfite exporter TauE/SafE family protein [Solirubrobacterales bacterium]|nr:sulfite exporter TauE/SafE family protein [Solirubrobacterales bacterium]